LKMKENKVVKMVPCVEVKDVAKETENKLKRVKRCLNCKLFAVCKYVGVYGECAFFVDKSIREPVRLFENGDPSKTFVCLPEDQVSVVQGEEYGHKAKQILSKLGVFFSDAEWQCVSDANFSFFVSNRDVVAVVRELSKLTKLTVWKPTNKN